MPGRKKPAYVSSRSLLDHIQLVYDLAANSYCANHFTLSVLLKRSWCLPLPYDVPHETHVLVRDRAALLVSFKIVFCNKAF